MKEEAEVAERNWEEFQKEGEASAQSAVEALFDRFEEQAEDPKQVQEGFAQLKRSLVQLYLDSDDLETRSEAFVAMRDILNGAVDLEEPGLPQLLRLRDDFRVWLTWLGFGVQPLDEDTAIIYGVPSDERLARRLDSARNISETEFSDGDWFGVDPAELHKFVEADGAGDLEKALKMQSVERLLDDTRRAIELEDNEAVRKALMRMAETFEVRRQEL